MGIQVALKHRTEYRYEKAIFLGPQVIQLRPAPHCRIPILSYSLDVTPSDHILNWQMDPHSNRLARFLFPQKTSEFVVEVNLVADLSPINPFEFFLEPGVEEYPFAYAEGLAQDLEPYRSVDTPGPKLAEFLKDFRNEKSGTVSFLLKLNRKVRDEINYEIRMAPGVQTSEQTLAKHSGSCRDSAWLLVESLRNLGIAARFVSGYLIQLASDQTTQEKQKDNLNVDSADLHAWAEAYLPGAGWIGMDPTSGLLAGEGHIPLVCTPSASQAAPIGGTAELPSIQFHHSMSVTRLNSARGPSKPFSEHEWQAIRHVAYMVDSDLKAHDVRLTMGGEPTYVALTNLRVRSGISRPSEI